jgi:hypothetical protein
MIRLPKSLGHFTSLVLVVAIVAILGVLAELFSSASTFIVHSEAESGQLAGSSAQVDASGASGGKAVRFASASTGSNCEVTALLENPCRPWLGAWADNYTAAATGIRAQTEYHEQRIGRQLEFIHDYREPNTVLSDTDKYFINRANTYASITWKPSYTWAEAGGDNATVNAQIDKMADSLKSVAPKKVMFSVFHEPENDVTSASGCSGLSGSSGTPAEYRAMWQNVRQRFDAKGVDNIVWSWWVMGWEGNECMIDDLYPGNNLVDWILYDPYLGSNNSTFDAKIGYFYDWMKNNSDSTHNYTSKIWGLAEYSSHQTSQAVAAKFWTDAQASLESNKYPKLKLWMSFDSANGKPDNRVAYTCLTWHSDGSKVVCDNTVQDNAEAAAYRALVNSVKFKD